MNTRNLCTSAYGIKAPIIREGDDLADIVVRTVLEATSNSDGSYDLNDNDIIGITESVVARSQGNYVSLDEITEEIKERFNNPKKVIICSPIYSRNRFSMILKALTRAASEEVVVYMPEYDEVGNPCGVNPFTGVDIKKYYNDIITNEGRIATLITETQHKPYNVLPPMPLNDSESVIIYAGLHDFATWRNLYSDYDNCITLADICSDKCEYGLLGSNKANEERLKLFPNRIKAEKLLYEIQYKIWDTTGKKVLLAIYGDGCYKDAYSGIWEFADPVTCPATTDSDIFDSTPNEIKLKAYADDQFRNLNGNELDTAIKKEIKKNKGKNLVGNMASQGTTPRKIRDLVASLCDLVSGSGQKGTPIVLIKSYFDNYSTTN